MFSVVLSECIVTSKVVWQDAVLLTTSIEIFSGRTEANCLKVNIFLMDMKGEKIWCLQSQDQKIRPVIKIEELPAEL